MLHAITLLGLLVAGLQGLGLAQDLNSRALADLEWGGARSAAASRALHDQAAALTKETAAALRAELEVTPGDLVARMTLMCYEEPENRRRRSAKASPVPHGELLLGLIEQHPRSRVAASAGLMLYPYKRDGMYSGPAWEQGLELWERLVREHPKDPAIASNAGLFGIADPFRMVTDGPRALELLQRARELAPKEPRWAINLGAYYLQARYGSRDPELRKAVATRGFLHLRAGWDLTQPELRSELSLHGRPLTKALASVAFDAGEGESAEAFARQTLESEGVAQPRGDVVFEMNTILGRLAFAADDKDAAVRYLLAAGQTSGSPSLGSFGPDMQLARELLGAGEREAVLEYLKSCKGFWKMGQDRLADWILKIESGKDPWQ